MLVPELRQRVYKANMDLPVHGLVKFTWGNVSAIDREKRIDCYQTFRGTL